VCRCASLARLRLWFLVRETLRETQHTSEQLLAAARLRSVGTESSKLREQARNLGTLVLHRSSSPTQNAIYYYDEGSKTSKNGEQEEERHHDSRLRPAPSRARTVPKWTG